MDPRSYRDLLRQLGVTLDLTYEIQSVNKPPAAPATPTAPPVDYGCHWCGADPGKPCGDDCPSHDMHIDPDQCLVHGLEPVPPTGYYTICGECYHCYPTGDDLRAAYRREIQRMFDYIDPLTVPPVEDITFCQECTHDF